MTGNSRKIKSAINSKSSKKKKSTKSAQITQVFTTMPMPIENPTSPLRYSFLIGLKNVLTISESEKSCKKA